MLRSAASKVMWVGRATSAVVGLAILFALAIGATNSALAHTKVDNKLFHLGHSNRVGTTTTPGTPTALVSTLADAVKSALIVQNKSGGSALSLGVLEGKAPLTVNASAGTATNLSADELDGQDSAAYQRRVDGSCEVGNSIRSVEADGTVICEADDGGGKAPNSELLDNMDSTEFALALHDHDPRYYTKTEVDTRLSGKANVSHQHSGNDITSGEVADARIAQSLARDNEIMTTVKANDGTNSGVDADTLDGQNSSAFASSTHNHDGRYYSSGSKVADSDKLDNKDSSVFGVRTDHAWAYADQCDTPDIWNECAPVTVTVPDGKNYIVSVWSSFSAKDSGGAGASQVLEYCSAGKGPSISTTNPCVTPFGISNFVTVHDYLVAASSSGETVSLSPGTYTFFTAIKPPDRALAFISSGRVITKVMVRDATNGL